jgi:hypothetical protein
MSSQDSAPGRAWVEQAPPWDQVGEPSEHFCFAGVFSHLTSRRSSFLPGCERAMIVQLDQVSRQTIGRFILKLCISVLIASHGKSGYAGTSGWLGLYAAFAAVVAMMLGQRFPTKSFNHWDEAWWLVAASLGIRIIHKALL